MTHVDVLVLMVNVPIVDEVTNPTVLLGFRELVITEIKDVIKNIEVACIIEDSVSE